MNWRRLGLSMAMAAGAASIVVGFSIGKTGGAAQNLPPGVEAVSPKQDAKVQRQTEIVADLGPGYDGVLVLNGVELPPDQYSFDLGQNLVIFPCRLVDTAAPSVTIPSTSLDPSAPPVRPQQPPCARATPGAELVKVPSGIVRATVVYWKILEGRAAGTRSFTWSFTTY
jgi:hypothetical protein